MEGMNFDRIGDDLVQAYEEGYQKGLEENKKNNNKLRNLQRAIIANAISRVRKLAGDIEVLKVEREEFSGRGIETCKRS